jgi:hypothetical protein
MRPRFTASVTLAKAFKPSNWTLTSRATKSKSPEVIEAPLKRERTIDLIFCVAAINCKIRKGSFFGSDYPSGPPTSTSPPNRTGFGVHRRGLVHKDIRPTNILVNGMTGEIKLTGFGIASRLPRERQVPAPPESIAGTLPYMAPEQTGRMNRSIDARSDLYALGVTLYQMLTGSLPFTAAEPMEWVHCPKLCSTP